MSGLDDLLRQRLGKIEKLNDYFGIVATPEEYPEVIIWGAGQQTKLMLEHANFFKKAKAMFIVDDTPEKQGTKFCGIDVFPTSELTLVDLELPVIIAATQSYPAIYNRFLQLGVPETRLIKKLVI